MAVNNKSIGTIIIVVLALLLLYALNPSKDDFIAWRSGQAQNQATSGAMTGVLGTLKQGAGAVAGAMTKIASVGFARHDYLICSTYSDGGHLYLGVAKLFIKLK
jgi:hypothetical protein